MKMENSKLNRRIIHALLYFVTFIFTCSCKNNKHNEGFTLEEIRIYNTQIDSVTKDFIDKQLSFKYDSMSNALLMDVLIYPKILSDSTKYIYNQKRKVILYDNNILFLTFSKQNKDLISEHYIFKQPYKSIVGYYTYKNTDILILTNMNDKQIFKYLLNNTFSYTKRQKDFEFIKYPKEQSEPIIYDPIFLCYKMVDGCITDSILTTNIEYSWDIYQTFDNTCISDNNAKITK